MFQEHYSFTLNPLSTILLKKKTKSKFPKAVINMKDLSAVFQPEKVGHAHGLQISYLQDQRMRNLFVYHENGQVSSTAIVLINFRLWLMNYSSWHKKPAAWTPVSPCIELLTFESHKTEREKQCNASSADFLKLAPCLKCMQLSRLYTCMHSVYVNWFS